MIRAMPWARWRVAIGVGLLVANVVLIGLPGDPIYLLLLVLSWPCVAWCTVLAQRPIKGLILYGLVAVAMVGFFAWSQLGPGLHPPPTEWVIPFAITGTVVTAVAAVPVKPEDLPKATGVVMVGLAIACCACWCGAFVKLDDVDFNWPKNGNPAGTGLWDLPYTSAEVRPAPPGTRVAYTDCVAIGAHGCMPLYTVTAKDAVPPADLVQRVLAHYTAQGWPLVSERLRDGTIRYHGCRPVRGILRYYDHCMTIFDPPDVPTPGDSIPVWEGEATP
jgi:hypothetical protein